METSSLLTEHHGFFSAVLLLRSSRVWTRELWPCSIGDALQKSWWERKVPLRLLAGRPIGQKGWVVVNNTKYQPLQLRISFWWRKSSLEVKCLINRNPQEQVWKEGGRGVFPAAGRLGLGSAGSTGLLGVHDSEWPSRQLSQPLCALHALPQALHTLPQTLCFQRHHLLELFGCCH